MSEEFIINTAPSTIIKSGDPYDHLNAIEWVDKQIEYGSQEHTISGKGLVLHLKELGNSLIGCEIGVCHGFTTEYFLRNLPNISKIFAVDSYPSFVDWDGTRLTQERQEETKQRCIERLSKFEDRVSFVFESSATFSQKLKDESLDFIFIDGDHSYEATLKDCESYWSKVKFGGIFAGHDINLPSVHKAVDDFISSMERDDLKLNFVENNAWFLIRK
jgi:predicted O-methyltransferase YrrM